MSEAFSDHRLRHGGELRAAASRSRIPLEDWLDLSTGINPQPWPVPAIPHESWHRLPEENDGLEAAARAYYGTPHLLPVAGSQAAIQALPRLCAPCRVGIPVPAYAEHARAWHTAGHEVVPLDPALDDLPDSLDVLVLVNPNNPTGTRHPRARLLDWHARLAARGGWLIVDEAFMDCTQAESLAPRVDRPGLVVLRSLGKFFGLAGARVGFVCAEPALLARLDALLGPWTVPGPSRRVAALALADHAWQSRTRRRLPVDAARLAQLLAGHGLPPAGGSALFQWVRTPRAAVLHERLARQGVLVRLFEAPASLRFGLPGCERDWDRLDAALARAMATTHEVSP